MKSEVSAETKGRGAGRAMVYFASLNETSRVIMHVLQLIKV